MSNHTDANGGLGRLLAVDIETTTEVEGAPEGSRPGLDPRYGAITDVALLLVDEDGSRSGYVVSVGPIAPTPVLMALRTAFVVRPTRDHFVAEDGTTVTAITVPDELHLLSEVADLLAELATESTTVVGWNSAVFDLPFLTDRIKQWPYFEAPDLGISLAADPLVYVKYDPLPDHDGGYRATIHGARHLDIQEPFKAWAEQRDVRHSLKPVAIAHGLDPIEVDRERMHELTLAERVEYVLSDAQITATLAIDLADELGLAELVDDVDAVA